MDKFLFSMIFTRFGVSWRYLKKGPAAPSSVEN